jgi:hypothetical protein
MIIDYAISGLSLASIGAAYWPHKDLRRFGCLFGLAAQPCWLYMITMNGHWGLLPLTPAFTALYLWAMWNHWKAPVITVDRQEEAA